MLNKSIYKDRVDEARDLISEIEDIVENLEYATEMLDELEIKYGNREECESDITLAENKVFYYKKLLRGSIKTFRHTVSDLNNDYSLVLDLRDKYVVGSIEYNGFDMQLERIEKVLDELRDLADEYDDWGGFL